MFLCRVFVEVKTPENLKWADSQEAVTLPWLSAHSIRIGIGGDSYIVDPPPRLSRINCQPENYSNMVNFPLKHSPIIDTILAIVLVLLVLEAALLPAENRPARSARDSIVSSIIRKWTRLSDN
jgi:hypothetical protein